MEDNQRLIYKPWCIYPQPKNALASWLADAVDRGLVQDFAVAVKIYRLARDCSLQEAVIAIQTARGMVPYQAKTPQGATTEWRKP